MQDLINILENRVRANKSTISVSKIIGVAKMYADRYQKMSKILNSIYIARNVTLNEMAIREALEENDKFMREPNVN